MPDIIIHSVIGSPYGRAPLIALEEKAVHYRLLPLAPGAAKQQPYLGLHPFGRIPVLDHDGFVLYETQAILRYVDRSFPGPPLSPPSAHALARMDQLLNICDWYLMQGVNNVIAFQRIVAPRFLGREPDEAVIAAAMPKARLVLGELERFLGAEAFLAGSRFSLADILCGAHIDFLARTPEWETLATEFPSLVAWLERLRSRHSFIATTEERLVGRQSEAAAPAV
jgi:glutathione S-transferase